MKAHQPTKSFCTTNNLADTQKQMTILPMRGIWINVSKFVQNNHMQTIRELTSPQSQSITSNSVKNTPSALTTFKCLAYFSPQHKIDKNI